MIGYGFVLHEDSYLRDTWCQLDFVVVTLAWVPTVSSFVYSSSARHFTYATERPLPAPEGPLFGGRSLRVRHRCPSSSRPSATSPTPLHSIGNGVGGGVDGVAPRERPMAKRAAATAADMLASRRRHMTALR